jgi:2-polyprenyl-6-hydroxyphenyl methylase/3-demethylubiquinone-9 3-methyltransferase
MIDRLKPVTCSAVSCKICGNRAELYGVVDFHKSCEELRGVSFLLSGVPVYYYRCTGCKFVFTEAFDQWSIEQFKVNIYNEQYKLVDPEYEHEVRPRRLGEMVARLWDRYKTETRVLDYGGGNDGFCAVLRQRGFPVAVTYDPMVPQYAQRPEGKFDLVTCFETLEHMPDPVGGIGSILEFSADAGLILFSTVVQPADFDQHRLNWWYVAPRNGHVSIFSKPALTAVWDRHGYKVVSFDDTIHLAFRTLPHFLAHLDSSALDRQKTNAA